MHSEYCTQASNAILEQNPEALGSAASSANHVLSQQPTLISGWAFLSSFFLAFNPIPAKMLRSYSASPSRPLPVDFGVSLTIDYCSSIARTLLLSLPADVESAHGCLFTCPAPFLIRCWCIKYQFIRPAFNPPYSYMCSSVPNVVLIYSLRYSSSPFGQEGNSIRPNHSKKYIIATLFDISQCVTISRLCCSSIAYSFHE